MSKLATTLKEEISRLGRKEANRAVVRLKARVGALEKVVRVQRTTLAALGRQVQAVAHRIGRTTSQTAAAVQPGDASRLSPRLIRSLRKRLKLSQTDFARLTGVTHVAVYLWESGRTRPQAAKREAILGLRGLGVREARTRLEALGEHAPARKVPRGSKVSGRRAARQSKSPSARSRSRARRRA